MVQNQVRFLSFSFHFLMLMLKDHKLGQKGLKIYEKGQEREFLDQKCLFLCGIFSGIMGYPPFLLTEKSAKWFLTASLKLPRETCPVYDFHLPFLITKKRCRTPAKKWKQKSSSLQVNCPSVAGKVVLGRW